MPSSWSSSLRFELQFTGENLNLWGDKLNTVLTHIDYVVAGWLTKALTADYALTTANAADDEARAAMLKFTGNGPFNITIPAVSKVYHVWNACAAALTITTGSGVTASVKAGEIATVICDAANVYRVQPTDYGSQRITSVANPINAQDVATKAYADNLAFTANAGILPGQGGSAGLFLTTNGTVASWAAVTVAQISDYIADQATRSTAAQAKAIAFAIAL